LQPSDAVAQSKDNMTRLAEKPEVSVDSGVTIISLGPAFETVDEQTLDNGLRDALLELTQAVEPPLVVLDLAFTRFFGSSFIEVVFRIWHRLQARAGGNFALAGLSPYCLEVLKVTHLDSLWRHFPTRAEAVGWLASGGR
jgi:anti-anti-sigma regulatory factor